MLVIVGSSDLWVTPEIASIVLSKISAYDPLVGMAVRVPRGSDEPTSMLEQFVAKIAPEIGRTVVRCRASTNKRGDVYRRDYEMVQTSIGVLAFFAPDQEMEGGTGHVVQAALAREIPVEAYRMNDQGLPELLGSDDGGMNAGTGGLYLNGKYIGTTASDSTNILVNGKYGGTFTIPFTVSNDDTITFTYTINGTV